MGYCPFENKCPGTYKAMHGAKYCNSGSSTGGYLACPRYRAYDKDRNQKHADAQVKDGHGLLGLIVVGIAVLWLLSRLGIF